MQSFGGTDPLRGPGIYTFGMEWLARGNVLVGVEYDTTLGADKDPWVASAKVDLANLLQR